MDGSGVNARGSRVLDCRRGTNLIDDALRCILSIIYRGHGMKETL